MTSRDAVCTASPLLSSLEPAQQDAVLAAAAHRLCKRSQVLFHEGDPAQGLFLLARGCIKLVRYTPQGKEMLIHLVHPGQSFAEAALFGPGTYPASAVAVEDSEVVSWSRPRLLELIGASPELALSLILSVSIWTRHLVSKLELLTQRRVEERLAIYLLSRSGKQTLHTGAEVVLDEAKHLIAAQLGTAPEVLSRTFKRLEADGVLTVLGETITILNGDSFRALASPLEV